MSLRRLMKSAGSTRSMLLVASALLCVGACSLDESGLLSDGGNDTAVPDAADGCAPCNAELAAGWELVAFGASGAQCPGGTSIEPVVQDAAASASACTCQCDLPTGPLCALGSYTLHYAGASCGASFGPAVVDGSCAPVSGTLSDYYSVQFAPTVAPCSATTIVDDAGVTAEPKVFCRPPATCAPDLCVGTAPTSLSACIRQTGDIPCPSGSAFNKRVVVSSPPTVSCTPCTCQTPAIQCSGTFQYFSDSQCDASAVSVTLGASCTASGKAGAPISSLRWDGQLVDAACVPTAPSQPTLSSATSWTVCCR